MNNKRCPHCGLINFPDAKECKRCKKEIGDEIAVTTASQIEEQLPLDEKTEISPPPPAIESPLGDEPLTPVQENLPPHVEAISNKHTKLGLGFVVGGLLLLIVAVYGWNYLMLQLPMREVIQEDGRNIGVSVSAHYNYYLDPTALVYDLRDVSGTNSKADVFRVLLQYAAKMKSRRYDRVYLAYRGETKFMLDGGYFQQLGEEYGTQNPVYTIRTFPSYLKRPDGSDAYGAWTGGLLGVLGKEMEDFNDFHDKWYFHDMVK
jgi:hypothetical protein